MKPSEERPWLRYYQPGADSIQIPKKTIYRYLLDRVKGYEDYVALDYFSQTTTYGEFFIKVNRLADSFKALGVTKGEKIVFVTVNLPETLEAFYALNKIGAIPVIIEPRMAKERIEHFVKMVKAKIIISLDIVLPKISYLISKCNLKHIIIQHPEDSLHPIARFFARIKNKARAIKYTNVVMDFSTFSSMVPSSSAEEVPYEEDSVCVVTQTGGTTGAPKGVMLKNSALNSIALGFQYAGIKIVPGDKFLNIMPIFTSYGVVCGVHMALTQLVINTLVPNFKPQKFASLMAYHKPNAVIGVPSFYESLLTSKKMKNVNLSDLTFPVSGGDLMNPALEEKLNDFFAEHNCRYKICQGYGLSEASAVICFSNVYRASSEGLPLCTTTMGIFDPITNEELPYNTPGEICISGPSVMKGYYGNEEETKNTLKMHADGKIWLHSGDLGYFDNDGFLFFTGRIKFVIPRFDGHKNFPSQIEAVVGKHHAVKNCAVVGVKDRDHSQGMWPLIVAEIDDSSDKEIVKKEIFDLCKKYLEERGQPIDVVFEETIPLTLIGKNDVTALSKKYLNYDYKNHLLMK